jgi:BirA family transcriptional regulator, biotin operon repressor / biotin---[acetyl-CoA-carboxylase] ligase
MTIGSIIERINQVDSTNNYAAVQLLTKRLPEGVVFVAGCQTGGRGQSSNSWESQQGKNLTFSIVLYPEMIRIERQFEVSKAISLGIADFLKDHIKHVKIKWPNDIYVGRRKIAGILIENSIRNGKYATCIVGIGLNINQDIFVSDAPNPVSLSLLTGETYDLDLLLESLLAKIDSRYKQLISGNTEILDKDYLSNLFRYQEWANYIAEEGKFEGKITGVDEFGRLLIQNKQQATLTFQFKEVIFCE